MTADEKKRTEDAGLAAVAQRAASAFELAFQQVLDDVRPRVGLMAADAVNSELQNVMGKLTEVGDAALKAYQAAADYNRHAQIMLERAEQSEARALKNEAIMKRSARRVKRIEAKLTKLVAEHERCPLCSIHPPLLPAPFP